VLGEMGLAVKKEMKFKKCKIFGRKIQSALSERPS